jgi:thiamine pyrophosphate-dependent acetolactate synthase large subunit-like protein
MATSITQSILDVLADAGASDIWGVVGDALNPLANTLRNDDRFRWIGVRHEEHAAYAAGAQSELTGSIGVCATVPGPGAVHLLNGLYNAKKEGQAVVAITGQVPRSEIGTDFHKEVNLTKLFDDVCAYQTVLNSPSQAPRMVELAVQKALTDRVVTRIEIPADVMRQDVPSEHFKRPLVHARPGIVPKASVIDEAAKIINAGKKVTLYCGIGCREVRDEVIEMAQHLKAPLAYTLKAHDIFEYGGNMMGMTGLIGNPAGYHAVWDCDVLVMLGTDFPYDEFIPGGKQIIQVEMRSDRIGRRAPVTLGIVGTVQDTIAALKPKLKAGQSDKVVHHLGKMRDKWLKHVDKQADLSRDDEPLHPQLFAKAISERAADDAIFGVDVGECVIWIARNVMMNGGRRMVGSFNHGSLGSGLPTALGAASIDPSRQAWAFCGDGGFAMSMSEFLTAVRYKWPVKVIVFNNSEFGFVKMEMEVSGMAAHPDSTSLVNPNFAEYAKACGGDGVRVEHAKDIVPAIEQAIASDKPFIIDAVVSAGELTMPPKVSIEEAWGFGVSKVKEGILGAKGDHEVWEAWRDEYRAAFS